ncbi:hypothetical protein TNCV_2045311 [Trichonephila clavipes]|uniref:Uncharacterized protein n=1 Tax=Trichonephila clavipes TaxID=2585209 RepID=A0A8X6SQK8_TRICX|nr:hypothetical protein TNCV_2045311 [Trichonephila clavipes]
MIVSVDLSKGHLYPNTRQDTCSKRENEIKEDLYNRVSYKSWRNAILNLCNGPRHRVIAEFGLATRDDCLGNHLYRLKVVPSRCSKEVMDSAHLLHCPALLKMFLAECYWEARDMLD